MKLFLSALGIAMILEGLPYFAFPDGVKAMMEKIMEMESGSLRGIGFTIMVLGLSLVYFGTR